MKTIGCLRNLFTLLFFVCVGSLDAQKSKSYKVKIDSSLRKVFVEADLEVKGEELIYNGGHVFGFLLDITFLKYSQGEYRLVDFFGELVKKEYTNASTSKELDFEMLFQHAVLRGGLEVESLLDRYNLGNEPMSMKASLKKLGLEFKGTSDDSDLQIVPADQAADESLRSRQTFFERGILRIRGIK